MEKHLILYSTKGGNSKSSLVHYCSLELLRLGYNVSVESTDQQKHVDLYNHDDSNVVVYDTQSAYTSKNLDLLKSAGESADKVRIIVPICTGKNDFDEVGGIVSTLTENKLIGDAVFMLSRVDPSLLDSDEVRELKASLRSMNLNVMDYVFPELPEFRKKVITPRTSVEICGLLYELEVKWGFR